MSPRETVFLEESEAEVMSVYARRKVKSDAEVCVSLMRLVHKLIK